MIYVIETGENMETNVKKKKLRKYTYTYVQKKEIGKLFMSFLTDLIVMLLPIAIWDAVMIGIFGSIFSINGLTMMNHLTLLLLIVSCLVLNPLIISYTRGQTLGMSLYGLTVMHHSGQRCNMHVSRLREIVGSSLPLCIVLLLKQPVLLCLYYGACAICCVVDKKHRTLVDFVLQTCMMKVRVGAEVTRRSRYDFHIHSSFSRYGEMSIEDIFAYAHANQMQMISITDLNTVKHNAMAHTLAEKYKVHYISGIEVKTKAMERIVSILGYGMDISDQVFVELDHKCVLAEREASIMRMDLFSSILGVKINKDDLLKKQRHPKITGEMIARYVLTHDDFKDCEVLEKYRQMDERIGYKKLALKYFYITKNRNGQYIKGDCYVEENYPSLDVVISSIQETGGMCVLADACNVYEDDELLFYEILKYGIDGLEVFRPDVMSKALQANVLKIAKEKGLVVVCGSDYYSSGKGRMIGECGKMSKEEENYIASFFKIPQSKEEA